MVVAPISTHGFLALLSDPDGFLYLSLETQNSNTKLSLRYNVCFTEICYCELILLSYGQSWWICFFFFFFFFCICPSALCKHIMHWPVIVTIALWQQIPDPIWLVHFALNKIDSSRLVCTICKNCKSCLPINARFSLHYCGFVLTGRGSAEQEVNCVD